MASVLQRVRLLLGYTLRWNIAKGAIVVVSTQPVRDENLEFGTVMNKMYLDSLYFFLYITLRLESLQVVATVHRV